MSIQSVFIDVDDTLILYGGERAHHYGIIYGDPYSLNEGLIEKLRNFKGNIVIWSGGGKGYADLVAKAVLPKDIKYEAKTKFESGLKFNPGDIIVDDQQAYFRYLRQAGVIVLGPFDEWNTE